MKNLLIRDGRLRSGWRVFSYIVVSRFLLIAVLFIFGLVLAFYLVSQGTTISLLPQRLLEILTTLPALTVTELVQLGLTVGSVYIWRRWVDKRSLLSLGIRLTPGWWREFLLGASLVGLMWTLVFVFAVSTNSVSIEGIRGDAGPAIEGLGLGLAFNLLVGLNEELDARGYVLQNLAEGVGFTPAVLVSAVYFGALHFLNPGAGATSMLGVALFGVLAALGYRATGQLWMPIGMHAAWNFFEGAVYGFLVSGLNIGGVFVLKGERT